MDGLIACHGCDLLVDVENLEDDSRAYCPRCSHFLTRYRSDAMSRVLAYSIAAAILLLLACTFPFLSFKSSGLSNVITLYETPEALARYGMPVIAFIVGAFIIAVPSVILALMILISLPLGTGRDAVWLRPSLRIVFALQTWSMAEVFIIAVLVSLVKIASMATVILGISFWAYAAFSICFIMALISLDRYQCWQLIERLETRP
jgi:paraquat-inducible protein A